MSNKREFDAEEFESEDELFDENDLEEVNDNLDELEVEEFIDPSKKNVAQANASKSGTDKILKVLGAFCGVVIFVGVGVFMFVTLTAPKPMSKMQPLVEPVAQAPVAQAPVAQVPVAQVPVKINETPVDIQPYTKILPKEPALFVTEEIPNVTVIDKLSSLLELTQVWNKENKEQLSLISQSLIGLKTRQDFIIKTIGTSVIPAVNPVDSQELENLRMGIEDRDIQITGLNKQITIKDADLKDLRGKNIWLRHLNKKQRATMALLADKISGYQQNESMAFEAFTIQWKLFGISPRLVAFSDRAGKIIQLREGETFNGVTIEKIYADKNMVETSVGKIFFKNAG